MGHANGWVSIPDQRAAHQAALPLCADLATFNALTFNALKKCGAEACEAGDILGVGWLTGS
jgi:alcohol dehydrogenase